MPCDPQELITAATPIQCCVPAGMQSSVFISLLCQIRDNGGGGGGGGVTQFIQLTDVPNSYAGQAGLGVRVNAGATGLEFYTITSGVTKFNSGNIPLTSAVVYTVPHGLLAVPPMVEAVLVCTVNDVATGYLVGDEISLSAFTNSPQILPAFAVNKNATNVIVSLPAEGLVGNEGDFIVNLRDGTSSQPPTSFNNFALKVYAWL